MISDHLWELQIKSFQVIGPKGLKLVRELIIYLPRDEIPPIRRLITNWQGIEHRRLSKKIHNKTRRISSYLRSIVSQVSSKIKINILSKTWSTASVGSRYLQPTRHMEESNLMWIGDNSSLFKIFARIITCRRLSRATWIIWKTIDKHWDERKWVCLSCATYRFQLEITIKSYITWPRAKKTGLSLPIDNIKMSSAPKTSDHSRPKTTTIQWPWFAVRRKIALGTNRLNLPQIAGKGAIIQCWEMKTTSKISWVELWEVDDSSQRPLLGSCLTMWDQSRWKICLQTSVKMSGAKSKDLDNDYTKSRSKCKKHSMKKQKDKCAMSLINKSN